MTEAPSWENTFTHEIYQLLATVKGADTVSPQRSAASGHKERIDYR